MTIHYNNIWNIIIDDLDERNDIVVRSKLLIYINDEIQKNYKTGDLITSLLEVNQTYVDGLINSKISMFTIDDLLNISNKLDLRLSVNGTKVTKWK